MMKPGDSLHLFCTAEGFYEVRIKDLYSDDLTKDEALGSVASALFSSDRPMFLRSEKEHAQWAAQNGIELPPKPDVEPIDIGPGVQLVRTGSALYLQIDVGILRAGEEGKGALLALDYSEALKLTRALSDAVFC